MTNLELQAAKCEYKNQLEGKKQFLDSVLNFPMVHDFVKENMQELQETVRNISDDILLRNVFLKEFQKSQSSNHLMVYINCIARTHAHINDGQPNLKSVNWSKEKKIDWPKDMRTFSLYCDLENNEPFLMHNGNVDRFINESFIIILPDYAPQKETYHYTSNSLEKITKGSATISFERLQLYYFRQLLETSRDQALLRIKSLDTDSLRKICLKK